MKKLLFAAALLCVALGSVWAQSNAAVPIPIMDSAVKVLAGNLNGKLAAAGVQKITVSRFSYNGYIPALSNYWANQLTDELANMSGRSYSILPEGTGGADWVITGEIVDLGGTVRVYTRLVRLGTQAIEGVFHTDLERSQYLLNMLASHGQNSSSSGSVIWDVHEIDSRDNPVLFEAGSDETVTAMARTIHSEDDHDFFVITAAAAGRVVFETSGGIDTYMELYDADTGELLDENDDGGNSYNARVTVSAEAGRRYIAEVRGYSDNTGQYSFRSYYRTVTLPDEFEPDNEPSGASLIAVGTPQRHTFHNGDDEDWIRFQITRNGRYTIRARGINSNELDTCIELYDMDGNLLDDDDDGGDNYDARLSHYFNAGSYRIKVWCYDDDPAEPYNVTIAAE